jgi:hypothetical protein
MKKYPLIKPKSVGLDFDGVVAKHAGPGKFPLVGEEIAGAVETVNRLADMGHKIHINTVRDKEAFENAKRWCIDKKLKIYSYQVNPAQKRFSNSPKMYAHIYIDDASLGAPVHVDPISDRYYYDWIRAEDMLIAEGYLPIRSKDVIKYLLDPIGTPSHYLPTNEEWLELVTDDPYLREYGFQPDLLLKDLTTLIEEEWTSNEHFEDIVNYLTEYYNTFKIPNLKLRALMKSSKL